MKVKLFLQASNYLRNRMNKIYRRKLTIIRFKSTSAYPYICRIDDNPANINKPPNAYLSFHLVCVKLFWAAKYGL